ncbi:hypothetical protein CfE428DRAFT_5584 [Chthoniobacter flavus Ellin428]|uniref:Esterase n=1 Tax=Chthoniobacter flavus Ellin428 TaxID=497964 RepID=B4D9J4_9BACT|nr:hypothetical protein [Chthoniobacter flavus]EDY16955.1 hypothetical protein CfE428DRAFT_5584 [Chthoniobacter flavus Ellin428]
MSTSPLPIAFSVCLFTLTLALPAPAADAPRPKPNTRDPHTPGYVTARELPDGTVPPVNADGNFIIGPTHPKAPEMTAPAGRPQGKVFTLTMKSEDSKIYPGIAREPHTFGTPDPSNPNKLDVTTSHPAPYTRRVGVYVPSQYVPGTAAPFIVGADGIDKSLFTALDNLIAAHRVPAMIAISIGNGSGQRPGQRARPWSTTPCPASTRNSSEKGSLAARREGMRGQAHQKIPMAGRRWAAVPAHPVR